MKRFISNYTILPGCKVLVNHITTVEDDGTLVSIDPFDRELGNTRYVPRPIVVVLTTELAKAKEIITQATTRNHLRHLMSEANLTTPHPGNHVTILTP